MLYLVYKVTGWELWPRECSDIARAGTLLTKCMRGVNQSYKSAIRLSNPNMICEIPLLFCMGPIQNVFTPSMKSKFSDLSSSGRYLVKIYGKPLYRPASPTVPPVSTQSARRQQLGINE